MQSRRAEPYPDATPGARLNLREDHCIKMCMVQTMTRSPALPAPDLSALALAASKGGEQEFEALYRATVGLVHGLCLRLTADPGLAEECVQRTYIQAWRNLAGFRGDSAVTTWLHTIAVNEVRGHFRREKRHRESPAPAYATVEPEDRSLALERAIASLPDRARAVFVLVGIYGYSHQEVGTMLRIAVGTSKAHYHRARKALIATLGDRP